MGVDLNEDVFGCVDIYLQHACSVEGAVQEHHQTLVGDVWTSRGHITAMFDYLTSVVFAVHQFKLPTNLMNRKRS